MLEEPIKQNFTMNKKKKKNNNNTKNDKKNCAPFGEKAQPRFWISTVFTIASSKDYKNL